MNERNISLYKEEKSKKKADEQFGRKIDENERLNKKFIFKEVDKGKGGKVQVG